MRQALLRWVVGAGVDYSIYVEMGTYRKAAHPFLTPAYMRAKASYIQTLKAVKVRGMR
jgi:hypothetical protein